MQSEWEEVHETGNLAIIGVSEERWFELQDQYLFKAGLTHIILDKYNKWVKYYNELLKVGKDPKAPKMFLKMARLELGIDKDIQKENNDVTYPLIVEKYGHIQKSKISVSEYLDLYLNLKNG